MTIRNLDRLFKPRSIALIGASKKPGSVGAVLARNLFRSGFDGPVMPVNPHHRAIEGVLSYSSLAALPLVPDLAVISTPPEVVPGLVHDLGAAGCLGVVVITAGFGESGDAAGKALRQAMLDAARPHCLRIIGPNCLGIAVPSLGLNATFAHAPAAAGGLACVSQSGAIATALLDWAAVRGIGFSHMVSLGSMADVDFGDMLDYLANDGGTSAIILYVEAVTQARKFMSAARAAARAKPVVVVKAGRSASGARAAGSHTGALAGSDEVYDAAFRRAGMLRVDTLDDLFSSVEALGRLKSVPGERLAVLTNGGGIGVLAADALDAGGGLLAELSPVARAALDGFLPRTWSHGNPVDIVGDADAARYRAALDVLLQDPASDAVLVLNCPTAIGSSIEAAEAVIDATTTSSSRKSVLAAWVGALQAQPARQRLAAAGIPSYGSPEAAVRAFLQVVQHGRNQRQLMEVPPSVPGEFAADGPTARGIVDAGLAAGGGWLGTEAAQRLVAAYGIPVPITRTARDAPEVGRLAGEIGRPVAVKILSPDLTHKSDLGGVALGLDGSAAAEAAAAAMLDRIRRTKPEARLDGFTVQEMVRRPGAFELILGFACDPTFGPVMLFGHGGVAVEPRDDKALALPPLNLPLATELIQRTRIARLLAGYRNRPPVDQAALALTLVKLAQLAADFPEIAELDINPLLADETGVLALDVRARLAADPPARLALPPYPSELEQGLRLPDGTRLLVRPVRPEDAAAFQSNFDKLEPADVRSRFFLSMKRLPPALLARLTQIDYDREIALLAVPPPDQPQGDIFGIVRLASDPDGETAEFAVIVRSDWKGRGLGHALMTTIIEYATARGIGRIVGHVLRDNAAMLKLADELGFVACADCDDASSIIVTRLLGKDMERDPTVDAPAGTKTSTNNPDRLRVTESD